MRQRAPRVRPTLWIADASLAVMHETTGGHSGLRAALNLGRRPDPSMQPLSAFLGCALTRLGQDAREQPRALLAAHSGAGQEGSREPRGVVQGERLHHVHGFGWHYAPPFGRSPRSQRGSVTCGLAASPTRMAVFAALGPLWPVQPPHLPNREACEKRHGHAPGARGRSARTWLRACRQAFPSWPREVQGFGPPPRPAAFRRPPQRPLLWPASRGEPF